MNRNSSGSPKAIVTDGLWRKSLSVIRSVGKAGFRTCVMGDSVFTTGFWSRYTGTRVIAPTAANDQQIFGEALCMAVEKNPDAVLFPMEDASLRWVVENLSELGGRARVLLPSPESIRTAQDKSATLALAEKVGVPHPRTWRPSTAEEFAAQAAKLERGGFVVKPRSGSGSAGVLYGVPPAGNSPENDLWQAHWEKYGSMLIQERIPADGVGRGVSLLMDEDGACAAAFAHERIQQYPVTGGPSTDRVSIHAPDLVEKSIALLRALSWRGIAMVEWKVDPRDGVAKLMEINPRFWGSVELAVRAGVDFPALYARAARGEHLGAPPSYAAGVRCRWMIPGEILRYVSQPRAEREGVFQFLRGLPGLAEEWDRKDLLGALATVVCTGALALNPRYWRYVLRG